MTGIIATVLIGGIVALWVSLSLRKLWKDKKNGKTCCSGDCPNCPKRNKGI